MKPTHCLNVKYTHHLAFGILFTMVLIAYNYSYADGGGGVYGGVRKAESGLPAAGLQLEMACPGIETDGTRQITKVATITNDFGGFTLRPPIAKGRCELRVASTNGRSVEVFVSDSSLRYELIVDSEHNLRTR